MHFDHIVGLADFWLTSSLWQKKTNTNIYGPKGIKKFCSQIKKLYEKYIDAEVVVTGSFKNNIVPKSPITSSESLFILFRSDKSQGYIK